VRSLISWLERAVRADPAEVLLAERLGERVGLLGEHPWGLAGQLGERGHRASGLLEERAGRVGRAGPWGTCPSFLGT